MRHSVLGAAAAIALLLGQGAGLVHLVVAEHERCPEHGELMDARGTAATTTASDVSGDHLGAFAAGGESHEHEHCSMVANRRENADHVIAATVSLPMPAAGGPEVPLQRRPTVPSEAVFRLAPKNSPPG